MEISEQREGNIIVLSPVGRVNNDTSRAFQPTFCWRKRSTRRLRNVRKTRTTANLAVVNWLRLIRAMVREHNAPPTPTWFERDFAEGTNPLWMGDIPFGCLPFKSLASARRGQKPWLSGSATCAMHKAQATPRIQPSIDRGSSADNLDSRNVARVPSRSAFRSHSATEKASCWSALRPCRGKLWLQRAGYTSATTEDSGGTSQPSNGQKWTRAPAWRRR